MAEKILLEVQRDKRQNILMIIQLLAFMLAGIFVSYIWFQLERTGLEHLFYGLFAFLLTVLPMLFIITVLTKILSHQPAFRVSDQEIRFNTTFFNKETAIAWEDVYDIRIEKSRTLFSRYVAEEFLVFQLRNKKTKEVYLRLLAVDSQVLVQQLRYLLFNKKEGKPLDPVYMMEKQSTYLL
ncbi:STM3941 family protein [Streptococcus pacificus]|uniref:YcxB family protein n=1 Tax=Streptococcus pacificus TaxID=2740577 RepID=A0ABS0ZIK6_9STRE|nr:STM3941 family protein [Streptococcus pacificus]MBJ8325849.1 hypothetical protein [Streptococcus pacificus]